MIRPRIVVSLLLAGALLAPALAAFAASAPAIVYLTRHAEKATEGKDPDLTAPGHARARTLARMLSKAGITAIFSTPTNRTRQTALPLATQSGTEVQLYDPAKPGAMVDRARAAKGPVLVVGHSNTVPDLVKLFGGAPVAPIGDEEYDRLYQLVIHADGSVSTVLLTSVVAPNP